MPTAGGRNADRAECRPDALPNIPIALYRTKHCSEKRGIKIACRLSIRLSVCPSATLVDQDHISWKSWKLIAWTISPTPLLFDRSPKGIRLLPGEHGERLGRLEVGCGKVACWSTKAALSLKRVTIDDKLLWRAYRNSPTLFRTVPTRQQ